MNYSKIRNGFKITVKRWERVVNLTEIATGRIVKMAFSDHVKAILAAKAL